ncbi:hypothetical protein [Streptomyces sp. PanSC19]|uniref:hypothetical protein n=1 Tax=Streptomyces sp. PanSC19 TaxID=1520455 RepID=UPI0011CEA6A9|nr:hypothetical protein [Streptomyces sp. PanSC19]
MTQKLYASPIWAKAGQEWKAIDTTLRRTGKGWSPAATNTRMVFSAGSKAGGTERASRARVSRVSLVKGYKTEAGTGSPLVTLTVGGTAGIPELHEIQLTWPGPVPAPIIDGSRALYPEIFPGADLVLTAEDDGFAQLLVLKNRQAAADPHVAQLSYGLSSPTLSFHLDPSSGIVGAEDADGQEVALSPTPVMWDSSGPPAVTDGELGASSQPTAPESVEPVSTSAAPEPTSSASAEELADDNVDPEGEVLPTATDEPAPALTDAPLPAAPAEPTPGPSQTGSAATLSLPLLNGPSPESRGDVVTSDLGEGTWLLTPDQDFLNDPATVYPVFIDPTVQEAHQDWTTAYSRHPKASFFNGKELQQGRHPRGPASDSSRHLGAPPARTSTSPSTRTFRASRSRRQLCGLLETYSWSCDARSMSVHPHRPDRRAHHWKNAPALTDANLAASRGASPTATRPVARTRTKPSM